MTNTKADVLIIEDEPLISMDLETVVEEMGHTVLGIARTHDEAIQIVASGKPELILADIQLADGSSGLDTVHELIANASVPVIFITAYPERFLMGEQPPKAWLLAKPFQPEDVRTVVRRALEAQAA